MPKTQEKDPISALRQDILAPWWECLETHGITKDLLAKSLKRELKAKKTTRVKVKGVVDPKNLGKGRKIAATSGIIIYDKDGKATAGDGDTVIEANEIAWDVRQKARMDAQKLFDLYPAEKHNISGVVTTKVELSDQDREMIHESIQAIKSMIISQSVLEDEEE